MTGVYTEYTLKALIKPHVVDLLLKIQECTVSTISKLTRGIRNLNANFKRLKLDDKFCNDFRLQCWRNAKESRRVYR